MLRSVGHHGIDEHSWVTVRIEQGKKNTFFSFAWYVLCFYQRSLTLVCWRDPMGLNLRLDDIFDEIIQSH